MYKEDYLGTFPALTVAFPVEDFEVMARKHEGEILLVFSIKWGTSLSSIYNVFMSARRLKRAISDPIDPLYLVSAL